MKKGKTSRLTGYKNAKITYGTVNSVELKSIYINIKTWVKPKIDIDNWERVVLNLNRSIKHSVLECSNKKIFDKKFIVDLDLRHSGIVYDKKSFMNLEITLFTLDETLDFKSKLLKSSVKEICDTIYMFEFLSNEYFDFYLTKNDKTKVE
jgi:hypothetical protein